MCVTRDFVFPRDVSYHISNLLNRCFIIDFQNISSRRLTLRNVNCSKYFYVIEIVCTSRYFEFRYSLFALFNCFVTVVIVPWIIFCWICRSLRNTFLRYFNKRRGKIRYRIRRFFEVFWYHFTSAQSNK